MKFLKAIAAAAGAFMFALAPMTSQAALVMTLDDLSTGGVDVIVLDNGPIHTSKATKAALAARTHWLSVEWLPKYAPELNDIETIWRDLKAHYLAHQTFTDTEVLDRAIHNAVEALNVERKPNPLANQRISA